MKQREELGIAATSLAKEDVVKLSQTTAISQWLNDESFAAWFFDVNTVRIKIAAFVEAAVDRLGEIITSHDEKTRPADVIKAADQLFKLAGAYAKEADDGDGKKKPRTKEELDALIKQRIELLKTKEEELLNVTPTAASGTSESEATTEERDDIGETLPN